VPRIRGTSIEEHHELVWADLAEAMRQLLAERDYDSINLGHIAARAGIARNTLYNYATDKGALVRALTERASRPMLERVTTIAGSSSPATNRLLEIIEAVLDASTDQALQLMFRPGSEAVVAEVPKGPTSPFHAILLAVRTVVGDGIEAGEFRRVADIPLTVDLLSGVMRSAAEQIARTPNSYAATVRSSQDLILTALTRRTPL